VVIAFLKCEKLVPLDSVGRLLDHFDVVALPVEDALVREGTFVEAKVSHLIGVNEHLASRALGLALLLCDLKRSETLHYVYSLVEVIALCVAAGALHVETFSYCTTIWGFRIHVKVNSFFQIVEDQRVRVSASTKSAC